jgi:hypothetical protein
LSFHKKGVVVNDKILSIICRSLLISCGVVVFFSGVLSVLWGEVYGAVLFGVAVLLASLWGVVKDCRGS